MKKAPEKKKIGRPAFDDKPKHPLTRHIIETTKPLSTEYLGEAGAYAALSPDLRRAVDVLVVGGTGAAAARAAGHKGNSDALAVRGHVIRRRPDVIAAVAEREAVAMEEAGLTAYRSWLETRRIAYFDPRELFDEKGNLIPMTELSHDARAAIQSIEVETKRVPGKKGRVVATHITKIKLWSKPDALKLHLIGKGALKQGALDGAIVNVTNNTQINNTQESADRVQNADNATDAALEYQQLMGPPVLEHKS